MRTIWLSAVAIAAVLAASSPCLAQSDMGTPPSSGATSSGTVSPGAPLGGATSDTAAPAEIHPGSALRPGEAAGTNEASNLSTYALLGVVGVGLVVGVVLVTFNHGNQELTTGTH